jgi:hypothetical protein
VPQDPYQGNYNMPFFGIQSFLAGNEITTFLHPLSNVGNESTPLDILYQNDIILNDT